ncbi:CoA-acylating methylmalonate-semialdehyde dehydrogenase [Actinomadura sp. B10D3]|uniref:CoA-acylating methylmalonate-semialdehyde dehydrogenase n=1 Tax=Actinomadura sp. B10D3 TaxID=3153557 RepID=UPI00325EBB27
MTEHWIDGAVTPGTSGRSGDVVDPATGTVTSRVAFADPADLDRAVASAAEAAEHWAALSVARRTAVLFSFRELLRTRADELVDIVVSEHGKVRSDAAGEVQRALENVEYACGLPSLLKSDFSANVSTGVDVHSMRQPVGVVGVISPFNFPVMVPMWFMAVAIACGNAVVLKPSEKDPSASNFMARLWQEAGLPDGVLNVVHGDKVAVDALLAHPRVDAISFVGSTPVARYVYETAARHGKRVQALGGAKNHMLVLPDADLDQAADAAVSAGFGSAGERCMAVSVVVAAEPIADRLVATIADRMSQLTVGDGRRPDSDMGPLVTQAHRDRVESYVRAGASEGATLVVDGRGQTVNGEAGGFWLGPTLFDGVDEKMSIYTDEIFGPVLSVVRVDGLDEGLSLINRNAYGNGAAIFTRDGGAARRFSEAVQAGMVGVNVPIPVPVAHYSFGGWKGSLFGDVHAYGPEGVHFFTRNKVITSRWPGTLSEGLNMAFPSTAE